jgi:hypothetical protein
MAYGQTKPAKMPADVNSLNFADKAILQDKACKVFRLERLIEVSSGPRLKLALKMHRIACQDLRNAKANIRQNKYCSGY